MKARFEFGSPHSGFTGRFLFIWYACQNWLGITIVIVFRTVSVQTIYIQLICLGCNLIFFHCHLFLPIVIFLCLAQETGFTLNLICSSFLYMKEVKTKDPHVGIYSWYMHITNMDIYYGVYIYYYSAVIYLSGIFPARNTPLLKSIFWTLKSDKSAHFKTNTARRSPLIAPMATTVTVVQSSYFVASNA